MFVECSVFSKYVHIHYVIFCCVYNGLTNYLVFITTAPLRILISFFFYVTNLRSGWIDTSELVFYSRFYMLYTNTTVWWDLIFLILENNFEHILIRDIVGINLYLSEVSSNLLRLSSLCQTALLLNSKLFWLLLS